MGCDIHPNFEKRVTREDGTKVWEKILDHKYEGNRHYALFGWLADVRNGYGFAGCDTGDAIKPLSMPRGLPTDIAGGEPEPPYNDDMSWNSPEYQAWEKWSETHDYGEHSQSWLTADEIIAGIDQLGGVKRRGVVPLAQFAAWDGKTGPDSYCGDIHGKGIVKLTMEQARRVGRPQLNYTAGIQAAIAHTERSGSWVRKVGMAEARVGWRTWDSDRWVTKRNPKLPYEETQMVRKVDRVYRIKPSKAKHLKKLRKYADRAMGNVHVRIEWTLDNVTQREEFKYFTDEIIRLKAEHGEVRMVFGFDS